MMYGTHAPWRSFGRIIAAAKSNVHFCQIPPFAAKDHPECLPSKWFGGLRQRVVRPVATELPRRLKKADPVRYGRRIFNCSGNAGNAPPVPAGILHIHATVDISHVDGTQGAAAVCSLRLSAFLQVRFRVFLSCLHPQKAFCLKDTSLAAPGQSHFCLLEGSPDPIRGYCLVARVRRHPCPRPPLFFVREASANPAEASGICYIIRRRER